MKNIRTDVVKKSLEDFTDIAKTIRENTSATIQDLLRETVTSEFEKIMAEGYDKNEDESKDENTEEIQDTEADDAQIETDDVEETDDDVEGEESESLDDEAEDEESFEDTDADLEETEDSTPEDWSEFGDYMVDGSDDEYDFSQADDETIIKVYKLLKNSDEIVVNTDKQSGKLEINDKQTGAEYIIDMNSACDCQDGSCSCMDEEEDDMDNAYGNDELEDNELKESKMIEIVLNEDSNLGYTDNYQSKDVMTTPSMEEPGKNVNDWDAGVPKSKSKPWAGKGTPKKGKPFNEEDEMGGADEPMEEENVPVKGPSDWGTVNRIKGGKGQTERPGMPRINECGDACTMDEEDELEEANLSQSRWNDTHAAHNRVPAANKDAYRRQGMQKTSKGTSYRANGGSADVNESMMKAHKKILAENKELKDTLNKLQKLVAEAAVTNMNLGQIVKILNENSTTKDEKSEIIARFGKEAKTVKESKELYAKISNELKKRNTMSINEEKQFSTTDSKKINENTIFASKDLMASLDLMHKICK